MIRMEQIMEDYEYTQKNLNVYREKSALQEEVIENLREVIGKFKAKNKSSMKTPIPTLLSDRVRQTSPMRVREEVVDFELTPKELEEHLIRHQERLAAKGEETVFRNIGFASPDWELSGQEM